MVVHGTDDWTGCALNHPVAHDDGGDIPNEGYAYLYIIILCDKVPALCEIVSVVLCDTEGGVDRGITPRADHVCLQGCLV